MPSAGRAEAPPGRGAMIAGGSHRRRLLLSNQELFDYLILPGGLPSFRPQRCSRRSVSASSLAARPQSSSNGRNDKGIGRLAGHCAGSQASQRSNALMRDLEVYRSLTEGRLPE
jgi:hypothetical protein